MEESYREGSDVIGMPSSTLTIMKSDLTCVTAMPVLECNQVHFFQIIQFSIA